MKWCVAYASDSRGIDLYEYSRAVLKRKLPDAKVVLMADFDGSSEDAEVVNVKPLLDAAKITEFFNGGGYRFVPMSSAKLVIPGCRAFDGYDRVLYLDTDVLVLDGDALVKMVEETDLADSDCAGAPDDCYPHFLSHNNKRLIRLMNSVLQTRCLEGNDETLVRNIMKGFYVNTGVVLFNMDRMRRQYARFLAYAASVMRNHRFKFPDQDIMNMLCLTKKLEPRFNDLVAGHAMIPMDGCAVAHYAGGRRAKAAFFDLAERMLGFVRG